MEAFIVPVALVVIIVGILAHYAERALSRPKETAVVVSSQRKARTVRVALDRTQEEAVEVLVRDGWKRTAAVSALLSTGWKGYPNTAEMVLNAWKSMPGYQN